MVPRTDISPTVCFFTNCSHPDTPALVDGGNTCITIYSVKDFETSRLRSRSRGDRKRRLLLERLGVGLAICSKMVRTRSCAFHFVLWPFLAREGARLLGWALYSIRCIEVLNAFVSKDNNDPMIYAFPVPTWVKDPLMWIGRYYGGPSMPWNRLKKS